MQNHTSLPNLCAKAFGAVLDGSPMTNVDKGIESCRKKTNSKFAKFLCKDINNELSNIQNNFLSLKSLLSRQVFPD